MKTYYEGFDIVAEHHFEAAGYTEARKCLFWLGVILRVHDFSKGTAFEKPALDKLYGPNWKNGFSVLMMFQRFATDMPETLVQKFMSAYSEEVEKVDTTEKYFAINGGYTFYGAFVHSGKTASAFTWMTAREAEKKWGLKEGTIRSSCRQGPLAKYVEQKLARKSEGTWIVSDIAMKEVYGKMPIVEIERIENFPIDGEAYLVGMYGGKYFFAWGPDYPFAEDEDDLPQREILEGESGIQWFETKKEAIASMKEAVEASK